MSKVTIIKVLQIFSYELFFLCVSPFFDSRDDTFNTYFLSIAYQFIIYGLDQKTYNNNYVYIILPLRGNLAFILYPFHKIVL